MRPTRREFLQQSGRCAGALWLAEATGALEGRADAQERPAAAQQRSGRGRIRVVQVSSEHVIKDRAVHPVILREMLESGLGSITGLATATEGLRELLSPTDRIAIKFNRVGAEHIHGNFTLGTVLVEMLIRAGWEARNILLVEAPSELHELTGCPRPPRGWSDEVHDFGGDRYDGKDQLAAYLADATAIINVPFLKHHNIAGVSGCMKNLSHALVRHPARYHGNGCSPFIGDIIGLPAIRPKIKLNVMNALQVVYKNGPRSSPENTTNMSTIMIGIDPVAVDSVAIDVLDAARAQYEIPPLRYADPPIRYIAAAAERDVGIADLRRIDIETLSV